MDLDDGESQGNRQKRILPNSFPTDSQLRLLHSRMGIHLNATSDTKKTQFRCHAEGNWYDSMARKRNLRSRRIVSLREAWTPCVSSATWGREKTVHAEEEKGL